METPFVWIAIGMIAFLMLSIMGAFLSFYKKVPQGKAIIRTGAGGPLIEYDRGIFVIPILHKMEFLDISLKKIEITKMNEESLVCKDGTKAGIKAAFFIRASRDEIDLLQIAQSFGCQAASDPKALHGIFHSSFLEATKKALKTFNYEDSYHDIDMLKVEILKNIGYDLKGFILDDIAIDYFEKTKPQYLESNA
jgi:uncharacterized membrane protein YqiK